MKHLNKEQQRAVTTTEGRILILAGAGSGKTSVLTHRIAHLVEKGISPHSILGLTFTNKAAKEMKERVALLIGHKKARSVTLSTFHSFCMQLLRKEIHHLGYTKNFSLYDERDIKRLTQNLARNILEQEGDLPAIDEALQAISEAKARGIPKENLSSFNAELQERLEACLRAYNAVDFDTLLTLTVQLFQDHPLILEKYQEHYKYVMIDEYQDTSPIQYLLADLISKKHHNLCVVGDDDQSIYGWRGAEIKNILTFEADTLIKLEQNYRSTPTILQASNAVIACNQNRHNKKLWSSGPLGAKITLFHAPTEIEEAQAIAAKIARLHSEENIPWKEIAILYRSNILSRQLELALMQTLWLKDGSWVRGIPYEVFGGTEFAERAEIKDIIAYLKVISNPLDQEALLRIINIPRRGISDKTLSHLTHLNRSLHIPLWDLLKEIASPLSSPLKSEFSDKVMGAISSFVTLIQTAQEKFQTPPLHTTLAWLIDEMNYTEAIHEEVKSEKMRDFKWENVAHCIDALSIYEEDLLSIDATPSLTDFLGTTLLDVTKIQRRDKTQKEDRVNLMTFHSAKGLEFTACYLACLEDHILPHEKSLLETGLEEERRLFYVALTRAKKHLTLSMARKRKKMGKEIATNPSRFLLEIPKETYEVTSWKTL